MAVECFTPFATSSGVYEEAGGKASGSKQSNQYGGGYSDHLPSRLYHNHQTLEHYY